jgi:hypothetical protein
MTPATYKSPKWTVLYSEQWWKWQIHVFVLQTPIRITTPGSLFLHATFLACYATLLACYAMLLACYDTLLACYATLLALYATLLTCYITLFARYDTLFARYDTLLSRYATLLARYDTLLARYVTLLTRLHASNTFWSQLEIAWKWLKPGKKNKELEKKIIMNIYDTE